MTFETIPGLKDNKEVREGIQRKSEDSSRTVRRATSNPSVASDKETYPILTTNKTAKRKCGSGPSSTSSRDEAEKRDDYTWCTNALAHLENQSADSGGRQIPVIRLFLRHLVPWSGPIRVHERSAQGFHRSGHVGAIRKTA